MKVERFEIPGLAQYSYVVSSDGKAVVVDAIRDVDRYIAYAANEGLKITHVLETHIHADFAAGSTALVEATGAELVLSGHDEGEHYRYSMPHRRLRDGNVIEVGSVRIETLHTPGHTPEHLSFVLFNTAESGTEPVALLSGDFLFAGSLGRPDLLGEGAKYRLARELYGSLHERIASLPDSVRVYPGHGAGSLCGAGMSDREETTLGFERATNSLFGLEKDAFVVAVLASVPEMPAYYPRMKELNAKGAEILKDIPGGRALDCSEAVELLREEDAVVVDLRSPAAFGQGHIPGAINLGAGQSLSLWAGWILDPEKRLVLVGDGGDEEASRRGLVRVGLDRIAGYLTGGMAAWTEGGLDVARVVQMPVQEVERRGSDVFLLDVRSEKDWESGHIAGAQHVSLGELSRSFDLLPRDRPIVAVCGVGYRASVAASLIERAGFRDVGLMEGGIKAWQQMECSVGCV